MHQGTGKNEDSRGGMKSQAGVSKDPQLSKGQIWEENQSRERTQEQGEELELGCGPKNGDENGVRYHTHYLVTRAVF